MYCIQCGAQVPDHAKFCQACGSAVAAESGSTSAENPRPENNAVTAKEKRPKRKPFPRLKKLLIALGVIAAVILAAVLIVSAVREHKRTTILGEIPDPEIFFGVSGSHYRYESSLGHGHNIEFDTEDVTKDMMKAYVDLLSSSEFPFVPEDTVDLFDGGEIQYRFDYNGSQELYDAASEQIFVEYDPDYEHVAVYIRNSGNFELVPVEPYNADNTSYESTAPADTTESEPEPEAQSSGYADCPSCYRGNCTACNGRKGEYSYSPGLDREWEECWKCNGTGNCSRCGGDGQIFG